MTQHVRRLLQRSLQIVGYKTGVMQLGATVARTNGAMILMYHSVADQPHSRWIDPANHILPEVFSQQMEFLSLQRNVVELGELVATLLRGDTPPAGTVVITFDDGYLDNFTVAAPILERYRLPATLFLPTGYIDRGENQWIDQVYTAFKYRSEDRVVWGPDHEGCFSLDDARRREAAYRLVCAELLESNPDGRKNRLSDLHQQLRPSWSAPRLTMNWDDVRNLLSRYDCFRIGGHTMEHTDLTAASPTHASDELTGCTDRIADELGVGARHFSFCYGRTSSSLRELAAEAGYEAACGGGGIDPVIRAPADVFRLPRVPAPSSMSRFDLATSSANTGIWRRLGR